MKKKEEYEAILFYVSGNKPEIVARWIYNLSCEIKRLYRALESKERKITAANKRKPKSAVRTGGKRKQTSAVR